LSRNETGSTATTAIAPDLPRAATLRPTFPAPRVRDQRAGRPWSYRGSEPETRRALASWPPCHGPEINDPRARIAEPGSTVREENAGSPVDSGPTTPRAPAGWHETPTRPRVAGPARHGCVRAGTPGSGTTCPRAGGAITRRRKSLSRARGSGVGGHESRARLARRSLPRHAERNPLDQARAAFSVQRELDRASPQRERRRSCLSVGVCPFRGRSPHPIFA